jgi:PKD repeat protein
MPVSFVWEFGDGQNFSGSGRPAGQDHYYSEGTYTARLTVKGSEGCEDSSVEKTFDVEKCPEKPVCPAATDIAVHVGDCDEQGRRKVTLTPKVDHLPVTFVWEFGDGQNSSGSGMPATLVHNYAAGTYTVKLTVSGGEGCEDSSVEKTFSVEKCPEKHIPPPPGICSWIMYLIEFIAALAVGTLMVHLFACPVTIWLIIFVLLTVLGIWFWYRKCDPTRCGWLQIFWVAIFAGTIVLLYLSTNGFQDTWLVALISLLIAIGIFVIWFKSCRPTAGQVFINGLLSMVAAMIVILLIATNCVGQPALPDLAVQDIDLNSLEVDCPGGPGTCITTVTFVIANSGVVDAGPFDIRILFDPDQSVVVTQSVPGLAAGASTPITITTPPGGNCYDQDCTICVTVDSGGVINESDETNNELCKTAGG